MSHYPTPFFIVDEDRLKRNLDLITDVGQRAGVQIIMAFKANALWRTFGIFRDYGVKATASSVNEMRLAVDELDCKAHSYCPVYTDETISAFIEGSSHITFNSVAQYERFRDRVERQQPNISCGLRINPMCSVIDTGIYDPCSPGSRFGIVAENLPELPEGVEGLHFHALCESTSYDLEKVLNAVETQFGQLLDKVRWLNMGGGHLMTRKGYDVEHLVRLLQAFKRRHPSLEVILEPGSAFCWQTGDLITTVVDIVENSGITTAIIDASFACHMPDCLEMPYKPEIAEALPEVDKTRPTYRLGGNSCLSGDFVGDWSFDKPLKVGDRLTLKDMNHYTNVKTNMFNGVQHPAVLYRRLDGSIEVLREYTYADYKSRMC